MPTAQKIKQVENLKARFERASGVFFTEYRGLSVPQMQQLRRDLRAAGAEFSVVKNTLFKLAVGDAADAFPEGMDTGPTAIAFITEDEAAVAKALFDYAKTHKALIIKGGYVDGTAYSAEHVELLSALPPKDVLMSQLIGTIVAPMSSIASTIEAIYSGPIFAISAIADKMDDGAEATAKSEPAEDAGAGEESTDGGGESNEASPEAESSEPAVEAATEPDTSASEQEPDTPASPEAEEQTEAKSEVSNNEETQE